MNLNCLAYIGAVDPEIVKEAMTAMKSKTAVTFANMPQDERRRAVTLFSLLVQLWKRRALLLLLMLEGSNRYGEMSKVEQKSVKMLPGQNLTRLQNTLHLELRVR